MGPDEVAPLPGIRSHLQDLQSDPIALERMLQQRGDVENEEKFPVIRDDTLEAAVARMTAAAQAAGNEQLILSREDWQALVQPYFIDMNLSAFTDEIIGRVGATDDLKALNRWLALANNIWNNTLQPDRGGKSANELVRERHR